ncbi:hypothetical protein QP888_11005, partial [Corynebacterium sp. MSK297]|uniref:hypothetical protein n=1 Tax=Corynebacterium sp. MSK297 TaxID=3050221 RepID=UPI00254F4DB3
IMSFCQKRQPSSPQSNAIRKIRIDAAGEGEFQYQAHGTPFEGVSVWILQMGPYAAATLIR